MAIKRNHPLFIGEKVYDDNMHLICEILEINNDKVKVSQEKYIQENKKMFDLDCEEDGLEWETEADMLYQFVEDYVAIDDGNPICYEHNKTEDDYPFFSPYLYENLFAFKVKCNCNDEEVVYDNEVVITKDIVRKAEQVLIDNGIEEDEASIVLQALGYVLFDGELYPEPI